MKAQYLHIEACARTGAHSKNSTKRKWNLSNIVDELLWRPHACPHVVSPCPPNILFGRHPDDVCAAASERAAQALDKSGNRLRATLQLLSLV